MTRKIYILLLLFPLLMGAAFQYGGVRYDITSITTSTTPVVLTTSSLQVQRFTGSSAQTVTLPDATSFSKAGFRYTIINESTGAISVNNDAGILVRQVSAASQSAPTSATFYVASTSTNGGPWSVDSGLGSGGGGGGGDGWNTYSANILCSSSSGINFQPSTNWISSVGNVSSGACTVNLTGSPFSDANYVCVATRNQINLLHSETINSKTTSSFSIQGIEWDGSSAITASAYNVDITCRGN